MTEEERAEPNELPDCTPEEDTRELNAMLLHRIRQVERGEAELLSVEEFMDVVREDD
jgi:hypothetical protein